MSVKYIYIHIPFCKSKCPYCDFFSLPISSYDIKNKYTTAIINELEHKKNLMGFPLKTLYFGGGSPFMLGMDNLKKIMHKFKAYTDKKTEISIELNPEHLEKKQNNILKELESLGFNRISIGVQTINRRLLRKIERNYEKEELVKTINNIKRRKMNLSLDFMFGLPGQKIKDLKKDLDFVKRIIPEHLSFYLFTPPDKYKLIKECTEEELSCEMLNLISFELSNAGYRHYEVSNFCMGSNQCIHNMAYWQRRSYLGIGAGAHSFDKEKKIRTWNLKDIKKYIQSPNNSCEFEKLDKKNEINEKIFLGLRLLEKGVKKEILDKNKYRDFLKNNLVKESSKNLVVTKKGLPLLNYISSSLLSS